MLCFNHESFETINHENRVVVRGTGEIGASRKRIGYYKFLLLRNVPVGFFPGITIRFSNV